MTPHRIARVAYDANEGYRAACGEPSQGTWESHDAEYRDGVVAAVQAVMAAPLMTAEESHELWMEHKRKTGWRYGPGRDDAHKLHPSMVRYDLLPDQEKAKDALFMAIVRALA